MLGYTRCASTACFTQADQFIAGIPVCPAHRGELSRYFESSSVPVPVEPRVAVLDAPKKRRSKAPAPRRPGEVRITKRVKLTPYQSSVDPATAMDSGCVYYVTFRRNSEMVKIGTTTKASQRFRTLCSQSGDRLRLLVAEPGGKEQEAFRHGQFAHLRLEGTEYFQYTREVVDHIAEMREQYPFYRDFTDVGRSFD